MKRLFITTLIISATLSLMAQQSEPVIFHNQLEKKLYDMEHPNRFQSPNSNVKAFCEFIQKLDSVVGSNDFDWTRFKNHFAYDENGNCIQEISFDWDNTWIPTVKSVNSYDEIGNETLSLSYTLDENGEWIPTNMFEYYYNAASLLDSMVYSTLNDSIWVVKNKREYSYNSDNQMIANIYYVSNAGVWSPSNKYEYTYNAEGKLIKDLYSTQRNGTWRESSKDTLIYNANGNCELLLCMRKGGMGPQGNSWRNSYKYEFEYNGEKLISELYYSAGWSSSEMNLESSNDYQYDANGNLTSKTASIFNGEEWIVRDTYDNLFDSNLGVNMVMGMEDYWNSYNIFNGGNLQAMPIFNNWQHCAVSSSTLDTEFTLYCSGFSGVDDHQVADFKIFSSNGVLFIESEANHDITIYDMTGRSLTSQSQVSSSQFNLKPGVYVVKVGNTSAKAIVR